MVDETVETLPESKLKISPTPEWVWMVYSPSVVVCSTSLIECGKALGVLLLLISRSETINTTIENFSCLATSHIF